MSLRRGVLCCCLVCMGAHALFGQEANGSGRAGQLWELGQKAMRQGLPDEAIHFYERCLAADPGYRRTHLSLAAAYLEKKDEARACRHLGEYLEAYPENLNVRRRYAELLARLQRFNDASLQYEALIADAQDLPGSQEPSLVPSHSRLVEIAEALDDSYQEHLHRGIGLYLLARQRTTLAEAAADMCAESVLCKAAAELTLANLERPEEARPCWYLYLVWADLGQRQAAVCRLGQAADSFPFTYLTPAEQRALSLASHSCRPDRPR